MGADLYIAKQDRKRQYTGLWASLFYKGLLGVSQLFQPTMILSRTDVGVGYYRDSYNSWNLLYQFDLDYWVKFAKYLDKEQNLTPIMAKKLLKDLKEREQIFEKNMADLRLKRNRVWDYKTHNYKTHKDYAKPRLIPNKELDRKDAEKYYRSHYIALKAFLNKAIKLNSDIECSI